MAMVNPTGSKNGFKIPKVKLEVDKKGLVGQAGIHTILNILDSTPLGKELAQCLPPDGSNRSFGNYSLAILLIASLLTGHDCLDDIEKFVDDDLIEHLFGNKIPTPKTMGNFLRRFEYEHIEKLRLFLTKMGYALRDHAMRVHPHKGEELINFKIDGTAHEQHGDKIEGVGWMVTSRNNSVFGLASQTIFDDLGFAYTGELLPASKPKGDTVKLLDQVLKPLRGEKLKAPFTKVARISGDSAFLNEHTLMCIEGHHAIFNIAAPRTIKWEDHKHTRDWVEWEYPEEEVLKLKKKGKEPPECYVGRWHWTPSWAKGKLKYPVILKKEWRADEVFGQECGSFHYHAVATNENLFENSYQHVIEKYKPRADVENMIREFKLNFDAKNLPCQKFSANEVYFLFVLISQNLIRWVALIEQPDKPHFSKKIRNKLIIAPGRVLRGGRQFVMRVKKSFKQEVDRFLEAWRSEPVRVPPFFSTA